MPLTVAIPPPVPDLPLPIHPVYRPLLDTRATEVYPISHTADLVVVIAIGLVITLILVYLVYLFIRRLRRHVRTP